MKAIVINQFGNADQLHMSEMPDPIPGPDDVLIATEYTSVNPVDWKIREGYLQDRLPHSFPLIPGWDAAGFVKSVGQNVTAFKQGDAVYAYCRKPTVQMGTYADYVVVPADAVARMPNNIDCAAAATIPLVGLTAWQCLFDNAHINPFQTILVHAAAGGVGSMAVQLAKYTGARVYATASQANFDYVKSLGADVVIDYQNDDIAAIIQKHEPMGLDIVLDCVGGDVQKQSIPLIKRGGVFVSILAIEIEEMAAAAGVNVRYVFVSPNGKQLADISQLIEQGKIKPPTYTVFPLSDAANAQRQNEKRHGRGKIVLKIK